MKFLSVSKDGGAESTVWAYWLFEIKGLCSVALLRFEDGSRDVFHEHAFNACSWVLRGQLREFQLMPDGRVVHGVHSPSLRPVWTWRETFHKVVSVGRTWVLTFRGPWSKTWREFDPSTASHRTLTHGRREVDDV